MEENDIVKDLTDVEVLESLYMILSTPIEKRNHKKDFNDCVKRLGEYITKIKIDSI